MKAYFLKNDYTHLSDIDYDIALLEFDGYKSVFNKIRQPELINKIPNIFYSLANFNFIEQGIDFPVVDGNVVVMSDKMATLFQNMDNDCIVQHKLILIDDTYLEENFDENGYLKNDVPFKNDYCIIQILSKQKLLDYEKSIFEPMTEWEQFPTIIKKFVLKEPEYGFPPIFRVVEKPSAVFVSETAKNMIENSNIKGCVFESVETS